ncbi:MAG: NADH-quinone oxidoreductase subunit NuoG [Hydrotalea sp.]|nr:NADH-quinone oxidoreductase subunit NuoG [Hydrotalea sp.]
MPPVKIKINNQEVEVDSGFTVLQACEQVGIEIPRFCYHDRLSIAGNCRMCLVEVKPGPPKPQASCALPVSANMEVFTDSDMVKTARAGVMEFLLINHPLDCPICDQGGQCDLQDQAMGYGKMASRYIEPKRAVADKDFGPLVATVMTRCIHCTRCVRFVEEVAGQPDIGLLGRGENAEISSLEKLVSSELSGNVIDLCPVGALTSKPAQFNARSWELNNTPGLDLSDAMGSNIIFGNRGNEILSITPRLNEAVNEEWLSDRARFLYDGLKYQRLDQPFIKQAGRLTASEWQPAITAMVNKLQKLKADEVAVVFGPETNLETMVAAQSLLAAVYPEGGANGGAHVECRLHDEKLPAGNPSQYIMNDGFDGVEAADLLLLIGVNPRWDAAVWNARIRKAYRRQELKGAAMAIYHLGAAIEKDYDLTYPYEQLGADAAVLEDILSGKHDLAKKLSAAKKPMLVIGHNNGDDGAAVLAMANKLAEKYKMGFNYLADNMAAVGGMVVGAHPQNPEENSTDALVKKLQDGRIKLLWLFGVDDGLLFTKKWQSKNTLVVYQGSHGDRGAAMADVILPSPSNWGEQDGLYINGAGYLQENLQAVAPKGKAMADGLIIGAVAASMAVAMPFRDQHELRALVLQQLTDTGVGTGVGKGVGKGFAGGEKLTANFTPFESDKKLRGDKNLFAGGATDGDNNFYQLSAITRASPTMAKCAAIFLTAHFRATSGKQHAA